MSTPPTEWNLKFVLEEQEARTRFNHIIASLQVDENVQGVEVSENTAEPGICVLVVRFKPGCQRPLNRSLHHLDKIHGVSPLERVSRYEHLLQPTDVFD